MREIRLVRGVEKEAPKKEIEIPTRGELKKQESPAEKLDMKMARIEKRTDFLLEKAQNRENKKKEKTLKEATETIEKLARREQVVSKSVADREQIQCEAPTRLDYMCLKKLPRKIIDFVLSQSNNEDGTLIATVDISDLRNAFPDMSDAHLRNSIHRLKEQGYFLSVHWSNNGMRIFKLQASVFK
jgi:seryl-tRNA synthetase